MCKVNVRGSTTKAGSKVLIQNRPAKLKKSTGMLDKMRDHLFPFETFAVLVAMDGTGGWMAQCIPHFLCLLHGKCLQDLCQQPSSSKCFAPKTLQSLPGSQTIPFISAAQINQETPGGEIPSAACDGFNLRMPGAKQG